MSSNNSSNLTAHEIKSEFLKSKMGIAGIVILAALAGTSAVTILLIPMSTFQEWNNPESWILYPKTALPSWLNMFAIQKIPEHKILKTPDALMISDGQVWLTSHRFGVHFEYDDFPDDFIYVFSSDYTGSPLLQLSVIRPDGIKIDLLSMQLPYTDTRTTHAERIFSTDRALKKNLMLQSGEFSFETADLSVEDAVFSRTDQHGTLKGQYIFLVDMYGDQPDNQISKSNLIIGGKAFGVMGTDELRRDLAIGLLWGTPLALFIGLTVAIASVTMGLLYGLYAGFKGRRTDEAMMRFNDVIYALPALPFLIILSVTISSNIFLMAGFLMIFGWVGVAKVARSMSLQIKTRGYVDAAGMMGQKNSRIIFRHMLPQLLPYAFASVAISVPAAITTEAGLSFLGLGDPSFPTWGHILHDASTFGAAARGLWWWIIPPGVMIALTGLAFVFIGNALDAIINPRLRK